MASDIALSQHPAGRPVDLAGPPVSGGLRLSFPCTGADLQAARTCEQVVFGRRYGNTPAQLRDEYGQFEDSTSFGAVLLPGGRAVGAVRLLHGGGSGLKTMQDAARPPWSLPVEETARQAALNLTATWDIATLGVDAAGFGTGSRSVTLALLCVMFGAFRDNGITSFVALLDQGARRCFADIGLVVTNLPGARPAPYLGSPASVPVYAYVADMHHRQAISCPEVHAQVFHGRGITGVDPTTAGPGQFARAGA